MSIVSRLWNQVRSRTSAQREWSREPQNALPMLEPLERRILMAADHISVLSPDYASDVNGNVAVQVNAEQYDQLVVKLWQQGSGFGSDSTVATVNLDSNGDGSFVLPADAYPHGPMTVRISGDNGTDSDNCYLQLYNTGGVSWNEGAPTAPPAAAGMALSYVDDFTGPLSISSQGYGTTYSSHKVGGGDFSGIPFGDHENAATTPFLQRDSYLRIRGDEAKNTTGLIASIDWDGYGITATAPCYFECRFIGPNATGSWPAFWVMTDQPLYGDSVWTTPSDELDVIEAYGGEGPGQPNSDGLYRVTTHNWLQAAQPGLSQAIDMRTLPGGGGASWFETSHTYGVLVGEQDTVYYCDDIEVGRHGTFDLSGTQELYFYINLGFGGGWPIDLSRYDGIADMYVDYVRVYQGQSGGSTVPAAPSSLSASAVSTNQIDLAWTDNSDDEDGFEIERATDAGFTQNLTLLTTTAADVNSYSDTSLTPTTTYYYRVRATNSVGDSNNSNPANATTLTPSSATQLTGTVIGTAGSYQDNPANTRDAAMDGSIATYFDAPYTAANGAWVGLDLGSAQTVDQIRFAPRAGWASRMVGGTFQASNTADFSSGVINLYTITWAPTEGVLTTIDLTPTTYRYYRYVSPDGGFGNVAEVQFWG